MSPDPWALQAAPLPLAFSQVREDPWVDQTLVEELGPHPRILMIASGGDTAAFLAAKGRGAIVQLVDLNPAQLALTRLKLHLLEHSSPSERLALLGHSPMPAGQRLAALGLLMEELDLAPEVFGPPELVGRLGPDHCGRYEILFAQLRERLDSRQMVSLLTLSDPREQSRRIAPQTPLGDSLDSALDSVMRLENLVCLFGEQATQNPRQSFSRHFAERIRDAFATGPARANPFLAQMLAGVFLEGVTYPWISLVCGLPQVEYVCGTAVKALEQMPRESLDLVHLSNILDWLEPTAATQTLELARNALRRDGLIVLRQLNSSLEIPPLGPGFGWRPEQAAALHRHDRSFFYRALHIGRKSP